MIIFLDFDGVLHPDDSTVSELFCQLPLLWEILRARPAAEVVFSTSWREHYPFGELLDMVTSNGGEDLTPRFIDATPVINVAPGADDYRLRELECLAWLQENQRESARWLALDDVAHWFAFACPTLYLVDGQTGLTGDDVMAVLERLA
ncbi:HAD domain-containing protein [Propionivibrio sp.]|uniref:HAD domain-containing protein n=1 Tax=Propionivibrio sp. TaxID=2212460 RepID=UPI003BF2BC32